MIEVAAIVDGGCVLVLAAQHRQLRGHPLGKP